MRRLFAIVLAVMLWFGFVETAPAQAAYDNLTPCGESQAFATRMKASTSPTAASRYEKYSKSGLLCGALADTADRNLTVDCSGMSTGISVVAPIQLACVMLLDRPKAGPDYCCGIFARAITALQRRISACRSCAICCGVPGFGSIVSAFRRAITSGDESADTRSRLSRSTIVADVFDGTASAFQEDTT